MIKVKTNILVVGLLSTGSSALVDMLREYDDIHVVRNEFNDFRAPGLVADQLDDFQKNGFINDIGKLSTLKNRIRLIYSIFPFLGMKISIFTGIKKRFIFNTLRIKQLNALKKLNAKLISSISLDNKILLANHWIQEIGSINNRNKQLVLFEQPLFPSLESRIWKEVFDPFKLIVVLRDPKDQLAEIVKNGKLYALYGAPNVNLGGVTLETIYGRSRKAAITIHIEAIKKRFEWIDSLQNELSTKNLLLVDFEGLVNNYDSYKTIIEDFIGIKQQQKTKSKLYFDPKNAMKSIKIYDAYLNCEELGTIKDLENWYSDKIGKTKLN